MAVIYATHGNPKMSALNHDLTGAYARLRCALGYIQHAQDAENPDLLPCQCALEEVRDCLRAILWEVDAMTTLDHLYSFVHPALAKKIRECTAGFFADLADFAMASEEINPAADRDSSGNWIFKAYVNAAVEEALDRGQTPEAAWKKYRRLLKWDGEAKPE